ncbi:MAG TPA: hypothetical protein VFE54_07500 [Mucilaginibacter sp.]|jgi:hypothetical protein|nr:hypothetical protein [Mucilaginibacter sp.]
METKTSRSNRKAADTKEKGEKKVAKNLSASYNRYKKFGGKQNTGMQIGRGHHWRYDEGDWKETKITPDLWEISYAVTKRRVGHAPENSGVPVGTEYQWYIVSHQHVKKAECE